jgi:hypothetical protein
MIKSVKVIRDEYFDNDKLSVQSIKDLKWHIENDAQPDAAISLVTDARLMDLVPLIAKHLDHEDDYVREFTVGCVLGRMQLEQYAERALQMAQEDPEENVCSLATSSLGAVIDKVNPELKKQMAKHIYKWIIEPEYSYIEKSCAFQSILKAMEVPTPVRITIPYDPDNQLIQKFKEKYGI